MLYAREVKRSGQSSRLYRRSGRRRALPMHVQRAV